MCGVQPSVSPTLLAGPRTLFALPIVCFWWYDYVKRKITKVIESDSICGETRAQSARRSQRVSEASAMYLPRHTWSHDGWAAERDARARVQRAHANSWQYEYVLIKTSLTRFLNDQWSRGAENGAKKPRTWRNRATIIPKCHWKFRQNGKRLPEYDICVHIHVQWQRFKFILKLKHRSFSKN